jgi:hypothetical protein
VPARPGGFGEQAREPLHPSVDGDVVNLDTALAEQFLDVPLGEAKPEVPANCQHDHVGWEAKASEGRPWDTSRAKAADSHASSLMRALGQSQCNSAVDSGWAQLVHAAWGSELQALDLPPADAVASRSLVGLRGTCRRGSGRTWIKAGRPSRQRRERRRAKVSAIQVRPL